jgi:ATP-dependent protease ClpP protease subunit
MRPDAKIEYRGLDSLIESEEFFAGIIRVYDHIDEFVTRHVDEAVVYHLQHRSKEVTVIFGGDSGDPYSAFAIYDSLRWSVKNGLHVLGICSGLICPAASMIALQGCSIRTATAHTRLLIEEPSKWVLIENNKLSDMEDQAAELKVITDAMLKILVPRCKKTEKEVQDFINRRARFLSASEALDFGLIDTIY